MIIVLYVQNNEPMLKSLRVCRDIHSNKVRSNVLHKNNRI